MVDVLTGTFTVKSGHAQMLKGGVIMDVVNAEQARIAEEAGAVAVMALERVPADIRADGGVARMTDPAIVQGIMDAVSIPVMAKCRIGHFVEAQVLEAIGIDYIDESEVLTPADEVHHVWKHDFQVPFVCGCRDLGEALRRISEGAAMIRTKGEAGTGDVVEAVRHMRTVQDAIRKLQNMPEDELVVEARNLAVSLDLLQETQEAGPPAGGQLRRRRCGDPGRRRHDDAVGRRRRLRRFRHLQVRRPGPPRLRHRPVRYPLQRPENPGRRFQGPGRTHGGPQRPGHPRRRTAGHPQRVGNVVLAPAGTPTV